MLLASGLTRARHLGLACLWLVPLVPLAGHAVSLPAWAALVAALAMVTAWRPGVGLVGLGLITPVAFALARPLLVPFGSPALVETLVLAFLAGSAIHTARRPDAPPLRLTAPTATMGLIVALGAGLAAWVQFDAGAPAAQSVWRHLTTEYLFAPTRINGLQASLRWIEVLALAAGVERIARADPRAASIAVVAWLVAGAGLAAQSLLQISEIAVSRGEGFFGAVAIARAARISAVFQDVNAAGSLFALIGVTALLLGVLRRRPLLVMVALVAVAALVATQSRAAMGSFGIVIGAAIVMSLHRSGRRRAATLMSAAVLGAVVTVAAVQGAVQTPIGAAASSRLEMGRIALKLTREAPVWGVGAGGFLPASRRYVDADLIAAFPEAATGENAHNNLLQVLAEFGVLGLAAFVWLLWSVARFGGGGSEPRIALGAGLIAFFLSAMSGHPLLVFEIAVGFFLAIGLASGFGPVPPPRAWSQFVLAALVLALLPWRVMAAFAPAPPPIVGADTIVGELDGQPVRAAGPSSLWRVHPRAVAVIFPMRWDPSGSRDCRIQIQIDGRLADEITLAPDAWTPVRVVIPPADRRGQPEVTLGVGAPTCQLWVGGVTVVR
jgi:O-antigen ligase